MIIAPGANFLYTGINQAGEVLGRYGLQGTMVVTKKHKCPRLISEVLVVFWFPGGARYETGTNAKEKSIT